MPKKSTSNRTFDKFTEADLKPRLVFKPQRPGGFKYWHCEGLGAVKVSFDPVVAYRLWEHATARQRALIKEAK